MNLRQFRSFIASLPSELDEHLVITSDPMSTSVSEITRAVAIPALGSVGLRLSIDEVPVVWLDSGGERVSPEGEAAGYRVFLAR